ncbi:MAG TPA: DUF983 domain-containing protein [Flavisolibacter sp.]|jgi:uncharacterized protein (DUF983 family)|nr:DUF983 domain-containing protein [Flavisolibacter sp.]
MKTERTYRSYLTTVLSCRCPRCREGKLFRNPLTVRINRNMQMYERCPVCSQPTDIEVGFYYGTGYVSYLLALGITGISLLAWFLTIGFSFKDDRFLIWIVLNSIFLLALQPWLMRFSRSLWLSFFVHYDPDWKQTRPQELERINRDQMNNW